MSLWMPSSQVVRPRPSGKSSVCGPRSSWFRSTARISKVCLCVVGWVRGSGEAAELDVRRPLGPNPRGQPQPPRFQRQSAATEVDVRKKNCLGTRNGYGCLGARVLFSLSRRPYTPVPRRPRSGAQTVLELCIRAPRLCTGAETVFFLNIHFRRLETRGLGLTAGVGAGWAAS